MLGHIARGISTAITVIYTLVTLGLTHGSVQAPEVSTTNNTSDNIVIENENTTAYILHNRNNISFEMQQALNLYSETTGGSIQFSVQSVNGDSDYRSVLRSKLLSGASMDLFQISGAREILELEPHMQDLKSALPWASKASPHMLDAVSFGDKIFGVPYSIEGVGLICNRNIFEEVGVSLADINSMEDLSAAFETLNAAINSGELKESYEQLEAVTEFPAYDKEFLSEIFADVAMSGAFESAADAALSQSLELPAADGVEEFVKLMARYSSNGRSWPDIALVTDAQQLERFANERVAVILQDTNVYKRVNGLNGQMQGRASLLPIPMEMYEQPNIYVGANSYWSVNVASSDDAKNAVYGFLTWLYQTPEGAQILAKDFGEVSPYRDTAGGTGAVLHNQMLSYLEADMFIPRFHAEAPRGWGKEIFAPQVQSYFTDREKTWEDVISQSISGWVGVDDQ